MIARPSNTWEDVGLAGKLLSAEVACEGMPLHLQGRNLATTWISRHCASISAQRGLVGGIALPFRLGPE